MLVIFFILLSDLYWISRLTFRKDSPKPKDLPKQFDRLLEIDMPIRPFHKPLVALEHGF
jgi:hypothetical protein